MTAFSNRLKALRKEHGLTQDEFSKRTGLTRSTVGMYEIGQREPNFETLELIADFFNVDIDYLLGKTSKTTHIALPQVANTKAIPDIGKLLNNKSIKYNGKLYALPESKKAMLRNFIELALKDEKEIPQ